MPHTFHDPLGHEPGFRALVDRQIRSLKTFLLIVIMLSVTVFIASLYRFTPVGNVARAYQLRRQYVSHAQSQGLDPWNGEELNAFIEQQAAAVEAELVHAIITAESNGHCKSISRAGACGLMQIIPDTYDRFGEGNPFDPKANIAAGTAYLSLLSKRYNGDVVLIAAAYNCGEGRVRRGMDLRMLPAETRAYVPKVERLYRAYKREGVPLRKAVP